MLTWSPGSLFLCFCVCFFLRAIPFFLRAKHRSVDVEAGRRVHYRRKSPLTYTHQVLLYRHQVRHQTHVNRSAAAKGYTESKWVKMPSADWIIGLLVSATARVISRRWNDDDEISFPVEETGVPGGNHRPTASNCETFNTYGLCPLPIELGPQRCEAKWTKAWWERPKRDNRKDCPTNNEPDAGETISTILSRMEQH